MQLTVRSLTNDAITNVAIIDLLPGGFEIVRESVRGGAGAAGCDYVDVREDRAVFYKRSDHRADDQLSDQGDESRRVRRAAVLCGIDV